MLRSLRSLIRWLFVLTGKAGFTWRRAGAIRTPGYLSAQAGGEAPGILDASAVAEQTLDALGAGPVVVPGTLNKLASFVMRRLLPRRSAVRLMSNNTRELTG